ncbi:MAG: hypothetical protein ABR985_20475 [Methanotrichaceae archaeon]
MKAYKSTCIIIHILALYLSNIIQGYCTSDKVMVQKSQPMVISMMEMLRATAESLK